MPCQRNQELGAGIVFQLTGTIGVADIVYIRPKLADQGQAVWYYPTGRAGPNCPKYWFRYVKYKVINTKCSLSHGFVMVQKLKCRKIQEFRHVNSLRSVAVGFLGAAIGPLIGQLDCDRTAISAIGELRSDRYCSMTSTSEGCDWTLRSDRAIGPSVVALGSQRH